MPAWAMRMLAVAALLLSASLVQAETALGPRLFPPAGTVEARPVRVEMGPFAFDLPRNARDIQKNVTGRFEHLSMRIVYPTMEGQTRANAEQIDLLGPRSRALQILISDYQPQWARQHWAIDAQGFFQRFFLMSLSGDGSLSDEAAFLERSDKYGLTEFKPKPGSEKDERLSIALRDKKWVFADLDGERARSVIECSGHKAAVVNPGCHIRFYYRNALMIKIAFPQSLLPDWRGIRDLFIRYLDEHRVM